MLMAHKEKVNIAHRTNESITNQSAIKVFHLPLIEPVMGAFTYLVGCWFAAVVFIFIPVLHFVLVPLAGLGGIGAFFLKLHLKELRSESTIKCPACKARLILKKAAFNWPMRETCDECRTALNITQAS
jgi:hypothetical protein